MLRLLHWLPVRQRVDFKAATLLFIGRCPKILRHT